MTSTEKQGDISHLKPVVSQWKARVHTLETVQFARLFGEVWKV